jgi:hypothetical protein
MSKDIIIYPSGDTTNTNPFIRFSGGSDMNYIMEITDDGYVDLSVEENIVTSGLTFYVDAGNYDSYSGGTTWYDLIGTNNGILTNGPVYDSGSIVFDGSNDRVIVGSTNAVYGNEQTWDFWVNRISSTNAFNMFGGRLLPYFGFRSGNNIHFSNRINGSQRDVYTSSSNFTNNTWYNFTFSTEYNGTSTIMKIYVNGVFNNSGTFTGAQSNSDAYRFTIGDGRNTATWYPFNGSVPIVKVYDRELSSTEVLQNYNAQKHRFGL